MRAHLPATLTSLAAGLATIALLVPTAPVVAPASTATTPVVPQPVEDLLPADDADHDPGAEATHAAPRGGKPLVFEPEGQTQPRFEVAPVEQHVLSAHDGVALHVELHRPVSGPDWSTPTLLLPSATSAPLGGATTVIGHLVPRGYAVAVADTRGTGGSGGCFEFGGPNEARDLRTVIEFLSGLPGASGTVGLAGVGVDATTANAAATLRPAGLATVVAFGGHGSEYDAYAFDGVRLGATAEAPAGAREGRGIDGVCVPERGPAEADPDGDRQGYWAERDHASQVMDLQASVLQFAGLGAGPATTLGLQTWLGELPTFARAVVGQWGDGMPDDAPDGLARSDWLDVLHAWLDHELLGLDTGVAQWPPVQVQSEAGVWRAVHSLDAAGSERAWTLHDGQLAPASATLGLAGAPATRVTWRGDDPVRFVTAPAPDPLHLSGQLFLDAAIATDSGDGQVAVTVAEVRDDGSRRVLTEGYLSLPHATSTLRPVPPQAGYPATYRVRTPPIDRTLAAGSQLELTLGDPAGPRGADTLTLDRAVLRAPVVDAWCGLRIGRRQLPGGRTPGCPDGIPTPAPRHDPGAAAGHLAEARTIASAAERIGGTDAVRETGYLTVRDGVEVAFEILRPAGAGPFPTLLTYDGYFAGGDPDSGYAARYLPRGYALAGLQVRGTGCSGGVFDFFQPAEAVDGYEMVEWLARQGWSTGRVATIGKSYPGITQLFLAQAQPPHLVAITPGHHYADVYRDVAFPGGIFNYGFAALWAFVARPAQDLQGSFQDSSADETCRANQTHNAHGARYNAFVQAQEHTEDDALIRDRSPAYGVHRIQVPVLQAMGWQDEQLSSRNVRFTEALERWGIPHRTLLSSGDHGMYREPAQMRELDRFLEAHLEQRSVLRDGTPLDAYLAEPQVTVFWEQTESAPRFRTDHPTWTDLSTPWRLALATDGSLAAPSVDLPPGASTYLHNAAGTQGVANPKWGTVPHDEELWDDHASPPGTSAFWTSEPLERTTTLLGSASADLLLTATAPNVDLQVTLTEVRPDGTEVYVQQGWLRASHRALDPSRSTELQPYQTHQAVDRRPLSPVDPELARVEIFPFGHVVRAGSRLRLSVEAPTPLPQLWAFAADPTPAAVSIATGAGGSQLVLPVVDVALPAHATGHWSCGTVIRQPCRPDRATAWPIP